MTEQIAQHVSEQIHGAAAALVPEIILLATACTMFLVGPFLVGAAGETTPGLRHRWGLLSILGLAVAWAAWAAGDHADFAGGMFRIDSLVWYTRLVSLLAGAILTLILWNQIDDAYAAEAHGCLLTIILGTILVAAADDLVSLFLALELVSIPTYVILYLPRRDRIAREAAAKYFLLSIFSSALVLFGIAWLYGVAGSTNLRAIAAVLGQDTAVAVGSERMLQVAFAFLLAGLSFRIAAVPFHFYAPDVFQGATASNAALLSFIPKVVGFVALLRLVPLTGVTDPAALAGLFEQAAGWFADESVRLLIAVVAVLTMFVGNLMALRQSNLYRLMAYSSIAHAGYMLIGLAAGDMAFSGVKALLFYLAVYGLMTVGVFALVGELGAAERRVQTDDELRGLNRAQPAVALMLAVCLFSLTGLPPTAGFLGKLYLFFAAWAEATYIGRTLAILLAVNAAIAAWYYLRLIGLMFLEAPTQPEMQKSRLAWPTWLAGVACTVGTIVLFFAPRWLWDALP